MSLNKMVIFIKVSIKLVVPVLRLESRLGLLPALNLLHILKYRVFQNKYLCLSPLSNHANYASKGFFCWNSNVCSFCCYEFGFLIKIVKSNDWPNETDPNHVDFLSLEKLSKTKVSYFT